MSNIEIRRPIISDIEQLKEFFKIVVTDTFAKEGLADWTEDIDNEIKVKIKYLNMDLESNGEDRYFLIALDNNEVVGTIEFGPCSQLISDCTNGALGELVELGTVFVRPDCQKQGIGNLLLREIYNTMTNKGIREFCLDSGYTNAQKIWKKKFGQPDYLLKDYWAEGYHHMIWRVKISHI